jgi:hypothetical protein
LTNFSVSPTNAPGPKEWSSVPDRVRYSANQTHDECNAQLLSSLNPPSSPGITRTQAKFAIFSSTQQTSLPRCLPRASTPAFLAHLGLAECATPSALLSKPLPRDGICPWRFARNGLFPTAKLGAYRCGSVREGGCLRKGQRSLTAKVRQVVSGQKVSCTYHVEEEDTFDPFLASVENLEDIFDVGSRKGLCY